MKYRWFQFHHLLSYEFLRGNRSCRRCHFHDFFLHFSFGLQCDSIVCSDCFTIPTKSLRGFHRPILFDKTFKQIHIDTNTNMSHFPNNSRGETVSVWLGNYICFCHRYSCICLQYTFLANMKFQQQTLLSFLLCICLRFTFIRQLSGLYCFMRIAWRCICQTCNSFILLLLIAFLFMVTFQGIFMKRQRLDLHTLFLLPFDNIVTWAANYWRKRCNQHFVTIT